MEPSRRSALHSFAYALDYLRDQVAHLEAPQLVAQPPGVPNHPAWTLGHLINACQMFGGVFGLEPWLPSGWAKLFGSGSSPLPDPARYEPLGRLLGRLEDAQGRIVGAVESAGDRRLEEPFPDPTYADVFPTVGHAVTQVLVGHTSFHVGQLAVWRRALGLPGIGRGFE